MPFPRDCPDEDYTPCDWCEGRDETDPVLCDECRASTISPPDPAPHDCVVCGCDDDLPF
jgi:hypothetical protein